MASYTFRWPYAANEVFVTGTFDDWGKTVRLDRHGHVFEKDVSLAGVNDKLHYKFVVDGEWTTDTSAPEENDGSNNINNVLYPDQIHKDTTTSTSTSPHSNAAAAMPATAALGADVPKQAEQVSTMSSAAPESTTADLAKKVPFENNKGDLPGSFPETPVKDPEQFSVNPIPASQGASNPVKLQPGEKVPDPSTTHTNTVQSTVRTDPAGYEQDASASLSGLANASNPASFSGPSSGRRESKIVPESGLPVDGESVGLTDTGVTIESTTPAASTAGLAAGVPLESQKQPSGGDGAVSEVPDVVRNSLSEAHRDPEAAGSKVAVEEKKEFEDELRHKVKVDESGGTPGPTTSAATTETAPVAAGTTPASAHLSPRSTPPPEPTVTTGVGSARTSEVSDPKGTSSQRAAATTGATESKASEASAPERHSSLTGPPHTKTSGASEPKGTSTSEAPARKAEPAESEATETSKAANGNGNGNGTVRKDHADKAKEQATDVAKEQKKKHRGSGFFQKLKEKLK